MGKLKKIKMPPIGLRIIKSAIAVLLCYCVSWLRGKNGIVFYSQLAALWCIQMYVITTKKNAIQRIIGTTVGAVYGLIFLIMNSQFNKVTGENEYVTDIVISAMIILVLYTTIVLHKKQASYFSCVVFLSIVVNHVTDMNPYLFVWNRFLDTLIGICIGVFVNTFSFPVEKNRDILFVSGLDDTLLNKNDNLSDYSRVELNRMLDEGVNFTISTIRTPGSMIEPMKDIRLKLPIIAMDGAVLYDICEKRYLKTYVISYQRACEVLNMIHEHGLQCLTNVIIDDLLITFYNDIADQEEQNFQRELIQGLRRSPYRNYVKRELPKNQAVVYFMLLYPRNKMLEFYEVLKESGLTDQLKVVLYDSDDYPGYSYIKIYNKNAKKETMMHYLEDMLEINQVVTFGSIKGRYDILIEPGDTNKVVHELKRRYEPFKKLINY